jgi:DNA-binding transcriptional ArsR family regulator
MESVRLDSRQIRVLAHPLRSRLLGSLRLGGPATATSLAHELGTNTGATSYHLRQLADVGLVVEEARPGGGAARPGSGRQRWWRAVHEASVWNRSQYADDPDADAAAGWLEAYQLERFAERARGWLDASDQPSEWRDAAGLSDFSVRLDPDRTRDLMDELIAVVERYRAIGITTPDSRRVHLLFAAVPEAGS